jgi:nucleoside-diphosphate-sugar epimerase
MTEQRRVLVTGASGFIGRHTLPLLVALGYSVHAVSRGPVSELRHVAEWHTADLIAPGAARTLVQALRPSHLLHLAWTTRPGTFWNAPENLDWVAASLDLYRGFVAAGGRRMVVVGTCAEYDWSFSLLDEQTTPCKAGTVYGASKDALHRVLRHAAAQDGVSLAWGRVFWVYGPHEAELRLTPSVVLPLLRGEPALCGEGVAERDFMHVQDLAEALVMVLDSGVVGPVNLASGHCLALRDFIGMLADQIGRPDLIRLGARAQGRDEPPRLAASTKILSEHVGFRAKYDLTDGLADTVAWWRARQGQQERPR